MAVPVLLNQQARCCRQVAIENSHFSAIDAQSCGEEAGQRLGAAAGYGEGAINTVFEAGTVVGERWRELPWKAACRA